VDICTIIAKNYVAHARVLAESFRRHHPDGRVSVLVVDDFKGYIDPAAEPFEVVEIDSIGLDDRDRMAASYSVTEFSTAVKPWLLRHLLERDDCEAITYLDPDIWIHGSLEEVDRLTRQKGLVLNPHLTAPLPDDGLRPNDQDILVAGTYNLGFISIASGPATDELLDWWSRRLLRDCVIDLERGYFVDQRWIDLAAPLFTEPAVLRDPGYNVAYWNLPSRTLGRDGDAYTVNGGPLHFIHLSGFDPLDPARLSRHQDRIELSSSPVLAELCSAYGAEVLAHGYEEVREWPYSWDSLPGGMRFDRLSRSVYRDAVHESRLKGSVYRKRGAARLVRHLNEPDELAAPGSGVTRYLGELYRSRPDLQRAFPDLRGADAHAFVSWVTQQADALDVPSALRPRGAAPSAGNGRPAPQPARASSNGSRVAGINLAGYLSSELGVGEAARQMKAALAAAGIETSELDVPVAAHEMNGELWVLRPGCAPHDVNLVCVNADMVPEFSSAIDPGFFAGRQSVGLWFWEVARFPRRWRRSFEPFDEVWVASDHIARAVGEEAPIPVQTIRLPVTPAPPAGLDRERLGLPEGFVFLFVFDYRSVMKRKNPLGLIDAFRRAFPAGSGPQLVIKAMGIERHQRDAEILRAAVAEHPDVHLIERTVGVDEKNAMIAASDCYVSLHRSEGFGLTLAEAMYFGKPVIATGYSGNLDFMTDENSYLVGFDMTTIGPDADPYPERAEWAEPDPEHAAQLMLHVVENCEDAAARGARAAADLRRTHSPDAAGQIISARLSEMAENGRRMQGTELVHHEGSPGQHPEVSAAPSAAPPADPNTGMAQVRNLLQFDQPPPKPSAGPARRRIKRLYMRLLRPYSAYQQRVNTALAEGLDEVRSDLARRYAAGEQARDAQLAAHNAQLAEIKMGLDRLREDQAELAATIGATAGELDERATRLEQRDEEVEMRATNLERRDEELEVRAAEIQGAASEMQTRAAEIERRLADLQQHSDALTEQLELALGDVATRAARDEEHLRNNEELISRTASEAEARAAAIEELLEQRAAAIEQGAERARQEAEARITEAAGEIDELASPLIGRADGFDIDSHPALGKVARMKDAAPSANGDAYRAFEDVFRGSEEEIRDRHRVYLELLSGFAPVLDLGCGRGELLDLLAEAGMEATGVDVDAGMLARCREKGHDEVVESDAVSFLAKADPGAFGTIFSSQLVEHLGFDELQELLAGSVQALRPGGQLLLESVNPHSPRALRAFWLDPTHRNPLYPETMLTLCHLAGYESAIAFCPRGTGDYEVDRRREGDYAVLARAPEGAPAKKS
jgi:SAM-dependent methyltransferase